MNVTDAVQSDFSSACTASIANAPSLLPELESGRTTPGEVKDFLLPFRYQQKDRTCEESGGQWPRAIALVEVEAECWIDVGAV